MKWTKRGRIYVPNGEMDWAVSHAYPPTPILLKTGALRVYAAFCDSDTVGRIGYIDLDPENPSTILEVSPHPVLDTGARGAFDDNGVAPSCAMRIGDLIYLYYFGFQLGTQVRYLLFCGLAVSEDGGETFVRASNAPMLDRNDTEYLVRSAPFVLLDRDRAVFRMWYAAGSGSVESDGRWLPQYNLRYLESPDGRHWPGRGRVVLDFHDEDEHGFGRPWILKDDSTYRLFYSIRTKSKGYRLGYAESADGLLWTRKDDEVGIDVSAEGWDSEMIAYSSVLRLGGTPTMFYCGNNCGRTGFGYATLDGDW